MAVTSGVSFVLSSILTVLLFSGMQIYKGWFSSSQLHTVFGGYLGSILFILMLTAVGNLEATLFGKSFQSKLFPEVAGSLFVAMFASGMVHRVATTTCFLFSLIALYYMNQISQQVYSTSPTASTVSFQTKKRKDQSTPIVLLNHVSWIQQKWFGYVKVHAAQIFSVGVLSPV
ncbi:protein KRTCAP2 homolog [Athalia rosae]|uniref:protein KRTCAP2 homolog n=1 Tax=Athalia rosae TaxID=37344 RepID=UPI00203414D7|nr:protein KRTCAP2 homolog [Athalia rosae]